MDNTQDLQQKIQELENYLIIKDNEINQLKLANAKLGYSTKLMSDFHFSLEDKINIADIIDSCDSIPKVAEKYSELKKAFINKSLSEEMDEFQMSPKFKQNLIQYLAVSRGENPMITIAEKIKIISEYFSLENKVRSTPDASHRKALTDKLLSQRPDSIDAVNKIIDIVNEFNNQSEEITSNKS